MDRRILWVLLVVVILSVLLFRSEYWMGVLTLVGIYALVVIGLDLVLGFAGQISLGHSGFFATGAYVSAVLTTRYALEPLVAMGAAVTATCLLAAIVGYPVLKLRGYYLAMATLAFAAIVTAVITSWSSVTGGSAGLVGVPDFGIGPLVISSTAGYYILAWGMVICGLLFANNLVKSKVGRALIAIHSDEEAALSRGIDVSRYKLVTFILSAAYASLAGSIFAHYMNFVGPADFDIGASIRLLVMLMLGGAGTVYGGLLGAAFFVILPEFTLWFAKYELLAVGVVLIIVMLYLPQGITGLLFNSLVPLVRNASQHWSKKDYVGGSRNV